MESSVEGSHMLNSDAFDDFAATVEQAGSGSDDDGTSDDFLSWLLVHADTIDPKLDFDETSVPAAGNGQSITDTEHSEVAKATTGMETVATPANGGADGTRVLSHLPVPHSSPPLGQSQPSGARQGHRVLVDGVLPRSTQQMATSSIAAGLSSVGAPLTPVTLPAPRTALSGATTIARNPTAWVGIGEAMPGGGIGAGAQADATVWGGMGGIVPGATLEGQLAAGAIPSDPVLAMQMGARMALSGNLNLIPFALGGTGGGVAGAQEPLRPQAAPLGIDSIASTASPLASAAGHLAWARHPPPPLVKVERPTAASAAAAGTPNSGATTVQNVDVGDAGGEGGPQPVAGSSPQGEWRTVGGEWALPAVGGVTGEGTGAKRSRSSPNPGGVVKVAPDGRRRKRMSVGELEERVKQASEDNKRLKLHLVNVNDKLQLMATRKKQMEIEIAAKLEAQRTRPSDANSAQLAEALSRFKDLYADYGAQRKMEVDFHLKQLERQIVPTDTTKMSLWTLDQDPSFFNDRKRGGLSQILHNELGVSEEQIARIQERRTRIKSLLAELRESLRLVRELQRSSEAKNAKFEEVMARLQSSFSPQQIARLILWVSANRAHISKLPLLPRHCSSSSTSVSGMQTAAS